MKLIYFILTFIILAILPIFISKYLISIILSLYLYFIVAQSYDLMGGFMGYINLSHYGFFGIGAYVFSILLTKQISLSICFSSAILGGVIFAILVSYPLFRLKGDYFALGTLAFLVLLEILSFNISQLTRGAKGIALPQGIPLSQPTILHLSSPE